MVAAVRVPWSRAATREMLVRRRVTMQAQEMLTSVDATPTAASSGE